MNSINIWLATYTLNNEFVFPDPEPTILNIMDDQEFVANLDYVFLCFLL